MQGLADPRDDLPEPVRIYIEAYNRRDVDGMLACLADEITFLNISGDVVTASAEGKAAFEQMARDAIGYFSSREQSVTTSITVAGTTVARIGYTAIPAMDLPNGWRVGERVTFRGRSLFDVKDAKIIRLVDES